MPILSPIYDEHVLVTRAQAGDSDAVSELWDHLTPQLYGYLCHTLRDANLAEDVLQNTWLKAIEALPQFGKRGHQFRAWLFAIARNECRQHWRKTQHEITASIESFERVEGHTDMPEEKIMIEMALTNLAEDDRELLRLRYLADLSRKEIAHVLDINVVAVGVRIHRALGRARAIINQTVL